MPSIGETAISKSGKPMTYTAQGWVYTGNGGGKFTEAQAKAATFARLMNTGEQQYQEARKNKFDPTSIAAIINDKAPILYNDENYTQGNRAMDTFVEGYQRNLSGAAIGVKEGEKFRKQMFPTFGQKLEPADQQARLAREQLYRANIEAAGGLGTSLPQVLYSPQQQKPQQQRPRKQTYTPQQMQALRSIRNLGGQGGTKTNPVMITNSQQYNALPNGAWYIDDNGYYGVKGQEGN